MALLDFFAVSSVNCADDASSYLPEYLSFCCLCFCILVVMCVKQLTDVNVNFLCLSCLSFFLSLSFSVFSGYF